MAKGRKIPKGYKKRVASHPSEKAKAVTLKMIGRRRGARPKEIAARLGLAEGTAKNLIWHLRRDGYLIAKGAKAGAGRQSIDAPYHLAV